MNILHIVQNNTNSLDTSLPLFWYIKENYPNSRIVIFYCVSNRNQVLRNYRFVNSFCEENNIEQIDFSDILILPNYIRKLWRKLFSNSKNDSYPISDFFLNPFDFLKSKKYRYVGMALRNKIEGLIVNLFANTKYIEQLVNPDIIFFDLRSKSRFISRDKLFQYLYEIKKPTLLLPHSPHDITPYSEIAAFDEKGEFFPEFTKYWIPFKFSKAYEKFSGREKDFVFMNYPAFDQKWINYNKLKKTHYGNKKMKCLIMLRNFYPKNKPVSPEDHFIVSYESNKILINSIADAFQKTPCEIQFIIKPHPKASYPRVENLLNECDLKNYTVTYDSFFEILPNVNLVISNFTTSLVLSVIYGVPTIIIEDDVQKYVNQWSVLEKMYKNLSLYCKDIDDLEEYVLKAMKKQNIDEDIDHLRNFFPDNHLKKNLNTIIQLLS